MEVLLYSQISYYIILLLFLDILPTHPRGRNAGLCHYWILFIVYPASDHRVDSELHALFSL